MSARYVFVIVGVAAFLAGIVIVIFVVMNTMNTVQEIDRTKSDLSENIKEMQLISPAFKEGERIPVKYTCDGENINPPFTIIDPPTNVKSYVFIVNDPDAPMGNRLHWSLWNISPETTQITENSIPIGATLGANDFLSTNYNGPCPTSGTHDYEFSLFALNDALEIEADSDEADIFAAIDGRVMAKALLIGRYGR